MSTALPVPVVTPTAETDPVPHPNEAADDIAVWVHPTDTGRSTIIGTDKAELNPATGGIAVYDLSGRQIQYRNDGDINNVDLRYNFMVGGLPTTIVAASNSTLNSIELYRINPTTRKLEAIDARRIRSSLTAGVSGLAMYYSEWSGRYYVFVNDQTGHHEQWELFDAGNGKVDARVVRRFDAGHETEGIVADDELGWLYVAEEDVGIWKYRADPWIGNDRTLIERVEMDDIDGPLVADVEGLSIYYARNGAGYLIASSQGSNDYSIFERSGSNRLIGKFQIGDGAVVDGVNDTDGLDVVSVPLGSQFPSGVFVAQDFDNPGGNQNFKLVPWERVAATNSQLVVDTSQDPRLHVSMDDRGDVRVIGTNAGNRVRIERMFLNGEPDEQLRVVVDNDEPRYFDWADVSRFTVDGLGGDDDIRVVQGHLRVTVPLRARGDDGNDTIVGGDGHDRLRGNDGKDKLYGLVGDDWVSGGSGSDRLKSGADVDVLISGSGRDHIYADEDDEHDADENDELFPEGLDF